MCNFFVVRASLNFICISIVTSSLFLLIHAETTQKIRYSVDITDENYEQIRNGMWVIGFFDKDTQESLDLEREWEFFSLLSQEQGVKFGKIFGPQNPALCVRFLVTSYPRFFYIKNGIAHSVKKSNKEVLLKIIEGKRWHYPKKINFLYNPFSYQMSLLSNLFVHAANLYNYEDSIVKKFVPFSSATDVFFGLTFIVVGTFLGLLITILFGAFQVFFMSSSKSSSKSSEESHSNTERRSSHSSCDSSSGSTSCQSDSSDAEIIRPLRKERTVRKRKQNASQ
ncbi:thioredoxin-related transmembrane protein 4-like [Argiope bruennichi]|uniref:thioredoxin-related transmembrane protein 4-like n=1 Tax=Argiope bruennichi TaxID=94029 RepID=UPI002494256D|nr:thioredoxin-related transmembrane protein 4-like [Argiope bruennichi]